MISSSSDSCTKLVAGKYDVLLQEEDPNIIFKALNGFLDRFERLELELSNKQNDSIPSESDQQNDATTTPKEKTTSIMKNVDQLASCEYSKEFKQLRELSKLLKLDGDNFREGELELNQRKNRYQDILPFEHTRVILNKILPDIPNSDYINANFIKGSSGSPRAYIACQGPLKRTLNDFWRMIWECNVSVVIMACNQYESGQLKCELYWPELPNTSVYYGCIKVTLIKVRQICDDFLIRKFSVKLMKPISSSSNKNKKKQSDQSISVNEKMTTTTTTATTATTATDTSSNCSSNSSDDGGCMNNGDKITRSDGDSDHSYHDHQQKQKQQSLNGQDSMNDRSMEVLEERTICQFHYKTWPDHGVPQSVQPILELLRLVRDIQPAEDKPILVHCSAGCGRTGTICCIDYVWGLLRRCRLEQDFDLYHIISEMRKQRMSMVQTLEQYILCHRAVAALFKDQLNTMLDLDEEDQDDDNYDNETYDYSNIVDELKKKNTSEDDASIPEKMPLDVEPREEDIYYDDNTAFDYDDEDYGPVFI